MMTTTASGAVTGYDWWNDPRSQPYHADLTAAAASSGGKVTPEQMANLIGTESSFNPVALNSSSGASGIAQILPSTAANPGGGISSVDTTDPHASILFAGQYIGKYGVDQYSGGGYTTSDLNTSASGQALANGSGNSDMDAIDAAGVAYAKAHPDATAVTVTTNADGTTNAVTSSTEADSVANAKGIAGWINEYGTRAVLIVLGVVFILMSLYMFAQKPIEQFVGGAAKAALET